MKKILSLLLVFALVFTLALTLVSCKKDDESDSNDNSNKDQTPKTIYELFADMKPTETVTYVTYKYGEDTLEGYYDMQINGQDSVFEFYYDKYRTSTEAIEDGDPGKIKRVTGAVYSKDGKFSGDGVVWGSSPVATEIKLTMKQDLFDVAVVSKDGLTLTARVSAANSKAVFGTALAADSDGITMILTSNGTYITGLTVSYKTVSGAEVKMETSYSYNVLTLVFPE